MSEFITAQHRAIALCSTRDPLSLELNVTTNTATVTVLGYSIMLTRSTAINSDNERNVGEWSIPTTIFICTETFLEQVILIFMCT